MEAELSPINRLDAPLEADSSLTVAGPDAIERIPLGKIGVWWFLASEIMVFGGLMSCYVLLRIAHGGWEAQAAHVNWRLGAFNTLVLVSSSLTMILAYAGVGSDDRAAVKRMLAATVALGVLFLGVKSYEYSHEIAQGFTPLSGMFWSFYYLMTGLHALHVLAGIVINLTLLVMAVRGKLWPSAQQRVEFAGLYWHFVDVVWIFLFPLLYLT